MDPAAAALIGLVATAIIVVALCLCFIGIDAELHEERMTAWRCSGVTDQNWSSPSWTAGTGSTPQDVCERTINVRADFYPCSLNDTPRFCRLSDSHVTIVITLAGVVEHVLSPDERERLGNRFKMIEPSTTRPN
jgi:hypothetical protein